MKTLRELLDEIEALPLTEQNRILSTTLIHLAISPAREPMMDALSRTIEGHKQLAAEAAKQG